MYYGRAQGARRSPPGKKQMSRRFPPEKKRMRRRSTPEKKRMRRSRIWKRRIRIARADSFVPRSRERIWPDCPDASGSCPTTVSCFTAIIITTTWYFLDDGEWLRVGVPGIYHPKEQNGGGSLRVFGIHPAKRHCSGVGKKKSGKKTTDSDTGAGASGGRGRESSVSMREKIPWKNRKKMKNI